MSGTIDAWDAVVGIDLGDWMRADSTEQLDWLTWLRDHPMPTPPPWPGCNGDASICDYEHIEMVAMGERTIGYVHGRRLTP